MVMATMPVVTVCDHSGNTVFWPGHVHTGTCSITAPAVPAGNLPPAPWNKGRRQHLVFFPRSYNECGEKISPATWRGVQRPTPLKLLELVHLTQCQL